MCLPKPITKETHKKILNYLDNSIYQIKGNEGKYGIGLFCSVKCHNKIILTLITNYQIINENYLKDYDYIEIIIDKKLIRIELGDINYMNEELDLSVIQINENKNGIIKIIGYYYLSDASSLLSYEGNEGNRFYLDKKDYILLY